MEKVLKLFQIQGYLCTHVLDILTTCPDKEMSCPLSSFFIEDGTGHIQLRSTTDEFGDVWCFIVQDTRLCFLMLLAINVADRLKDIDNIKNLFDWHWVDKNCFKFIVRCNKYDICYLPPSQEQFGICWQSQCKWLQVMAIQWSGCYWLLQSMLMQVISIDTESRTWLSYVALICVWCLLWIWYFWIFCCWKIQKHFVILVFSGHLGIQKNFFISALLCQRKMQKYFIKNCWHGGKIGSKRQHTKFYILISLSLYNNLIFEVHVAICGIIFYLASSITEL